MVNKYSFHKRLLIYYLVLLLCLDMSGRAGQLQIKGNKLLLSVGYRINPQGGLLKAERLGAESEVGRFGPTPSGGGVTSTAERSSR